MGGGFLMTICEECHGNGKIFKNKDSNTTSESRNLDVSTTNKIDKRSKAYKDAIKELTKSGLSKQEAEKVFSQEMDRLDGKD